MATDAQSIDFILEQGAGAGQLTARKMFGEFGLYLDGKIIGLICDDTLFLKVSEAGRRLLGEPIMAAAYTGAKPSFNISLDACEDRDWFIELLQATYRGLPAPKPKKATKNGT
ncbi:MAG: TfoX/Sxy family protein [Deltaproteobacteria bacterium]